MTPTEPKPVASLAKFLNGTDNPPPVLMTRSKSKSIATRLTLENIADFSIFLKTQFEPDEMDAVAPMSTLDIQKRMMTALPQGYDAFQPKAEQPTAGHAEFLKTLINEQARPKSMPYNKAACDSSSYNYASGRLDHQTYYGHLDVDRDDCDDCVLDGGDGHADAARSSSDAQPGIHR